MRLFDPIMISNDDMIPNVHNVISGIDRDSL